MEMQDKVHIRNSKNSFTAGQVASGLADNYVQATDEMISGMSLFKQAAYAQRNVAVDKAQGKLFEYIEAAKFNADAARQGSDIRAFVTAAEGRHTAPDDLIIRRGNEELQKVQLKSMNPDSYNGKGIYKQTVEISDPKYRNMQKVVNKGHEEEVRRIAGKGAKSNLKRSPDYEDTVRNVKGSTQYGNIDSGGTSFKENIFAAKNPKLYAAMMELKNVGIEAGITGAYAGASSAIVGGFVSAIKNSIAVVKQEKSPKEALSNTITDTGKSGAKGIATGIGGSLIRYGATKSGVTSLSKLNIATTVAAGLIDVGVLVYDYSKGNITSEQAMVQIGNTGVSTMSGIYAGMVAGAVFGPVGAIVGSMVGYMIATNVYHSCITIFQNAKLKEEEALRIVTLCEEVCREMEQQRQLFVEQFTLQLQARREEFASCFSTLDQGLEQDNPEVSTAALSELVNVIGQKLTFASFNEFDDFMMNTDKPLKL